MGLCISHVLRQNKVAQWDCLCCCIPVVSYLQGTAFKVCEEKLPRINTTTCLHSHTSEPLLHP